MPAYRSQNCIRSIYQNLLAGIIILSFVTSSNGQSIAAEFSRISDHYVDSTSIPGIHFELNGPNYVDNQRIVIGPLTRIVLLPGKKSLHNNIEYKLGKQAPKIYLAPILISNGGTYEVMVRLQTPEAGAAFHSITVTVDAESPVVTTSIVYKSITLKRFHLVESKPQNGILPIECPVGSELHIEVKDNIFASQKAFLKEGNAIFKVVDGAVELRSRGRHQYKIVASDLLGNTTESPQILLDIIEE